MRLIRLAAVIAGLVVSTQAATIFSDGFNGAPLPGSFQTIFAGETTLSPWTVGGSVDWIGGYWQTAEGHGSVDMAGNGAGTLSTTLNTIAGQTYALSFYLAGNPDGGNQTKTLHVQVGTLPIPDFTFDTAGHGKGSMGWVLETVNFTAVGNDNLTFTSGEGSSPWGPALDGVTVSSAAAVPEPASCALMLFGLAGMIAVFRRRR